MYLLIENMSYTKENLCRTENAHSIYEYTSDQT